MLINSHVNRSSNGYPVSTNYREIPSTLTRECRLKFKEFIFNSLQEMNIDGSNVEFSFFLFRNLRK